jgi:hypothetical protein
MKTFSVYIKKILIIERYKTIWYNKGMEFYTLSIIIKNNCHSPPPN